jgi:hypothetical protein
MKTVLYQVLFFGLIPFGIFFLIKAIKLIRRTFSGNIILEIPYSLKSADFEITKTGVFSIWHKGQIFRKAPLDKYKPLIRNTVSNEEIILIPSLFRANTNNGFTARMELFRFSAPAGKYNMMITEGSSISMLDRGITHLFPLKMVDFENYYLQIRESQPFYYVLIGISLLIMAGFFIIGGTVLGFLADQLISK